MGDDMNEVVTLQAAEPRKILQTAIDEKIPATMSYLVRGKWHAAEILLAGLEAERLNIEHAGPEKRPKPININVNQPVGISFRHGNGKFVFDTTVIDLESAGQGPSRTDPQSRHIGSENLTIALAVPDRVESVQRRSYSRANVPESLKVNVLLWHRRSEREAQNQTQGTPEEIHNHCKGRLVDVSAGGARVVIPHADSVSQDSPDAPTPDFTEGQFVGMRFTPMPYEKPLILNAQIRNVLPTAGKGTCLGLQIIGLEASPEGRRVLTRLVGVVERYYQINLSSAKQQDTEAVPDAVKQTDY
jgi:hypothetical protein